MTENSAFPAHAALIRDVFLANIALLDPAVYLTETALAISLMLGFAVRLAGIVAIVFTLNLWIGLYRSAAEWPWQYVFLIVTHAFFGTGPRRPQPRARRHGRPVAVGAAGRAVFCGARLPPCILNGQRRAMTMVVQALSSLASSRLGAIRTCSRRSSPRMTGQYGSGWSSVSSNRRRPAHPPPHAAW